jgi:hypothetical protein
MKHKCREVDQALTRLMDTLCSWERDTSRGSTLILIPHEDDEDIVLVQDGKPLPENTNISPARLVEIALYLRNESTRRKMK